MTGSENQQKTSKPEAVQLPLKGMFSEPYKDARGHVYRIENVGDGRLRIHFAKRQPEKK